MQNPHSFEIIVNGYSEQPVPIFVNPKSDVIIGLLGGAPGSFTLGGSISGFVIGPDVYLWNAEICKLEEFAREWEHGNLCDEFENGFWMEVEDETEIQLTLARHFRGHHVFQELEAVASICYIG